MNEQEIITSRDNAKLKFARGVRDGRETGIIFIEGTRLVREAFRSNIDIVQVLVSADFSETEKYCELSELIEGKRLAVTKVASNLFASIADTENAQGVVVLAHRPRFKLADLDMSVRSAMVIFLNRVNNPSNLGAVVRTAEAADALALITSEGSSNAFSPKSIRASMGSCFRLPLIEGVTINEARKWAKLNGIVSTAADIKATAKYTEIDWSIPRLLVLGSEAHGLNEEELGQIEQMIKIPMSNDVESLNLAVSAGIILFEAKRQIERSETMGQPK